MVIYICLLLLAGEAICTVAKEGVMNTQIQDLQRGQDSHFNFKDQGLQDFIVSNKTL